MASRRMQQRWGTGAVLANNLAFGIQNAPAE
jgi:hypothetical protein